MLLVRYQHGGVIKHGVLEGDRIEEIEGDFFGAMRRSGAMVSLADVRLKAPTSPTKVINMAGNYLSHMGARPPFKEPQPFLATPSSVLDPGGVIVFPPGAKNVHYEGEMAVVINRRASRVSEADAASFVLGVCAANDVSERDWQGGAEKDVQWWRAKSADTFSPFGPWLATGLDHGSLDLETRVNGKTVQKCNTSDLIFGVERIISFVSQAMTLEPGDVIFTGTSGQTSAMKDGDVVEVELQDVGVLRNTVSAG